MLSCATTTTPGPQAAASKVQAVPCPSLPPLHYHAPQTKAEADKFIGRQFPDPQNVYDTPETVTEILRMNAAIAAVCLRFTK
jgi:hypothetical protein